jgi:hypothetical protein
MSITVQLIVAKKAYEHNCDICYIIRWHVGTMPPLSNLDLVWLAPWRVKKFPPGAYLLRSVSSQLGEL